jgi:lysophospholipase L1-like esterase
MRTILIAFIFLAGTFAEARASTRPLHLKFDFGPGPVASGYTQVLPTTVYSKRRGYGFEPGAHISCFDRGGPDDLRRDLCTSDRPFFFSVALPEGNYRVKIILGDAKEATATTVKAELRRLMLERVETAPGQFQTREFVVNIRTPHIAGDGEVRLKDREKEIEAWAWDEKLTLEFNGEHPAIAALEISRADVPTVFLLGDSTVCDQPLEPYSSWGQMLPRFFGPAIAIANHAESGESLRSSLAAHRLDKVLSAMRPGDYLLIQYGHNDEKEKGGGPFTTYKEALRLFVERARQRGGIPVLITPVHRRTFDATGKIINSHGDYPKAMRQVARELNVPLIDLNAMSEAFYEALGPERSKLAFKEGDNTHHNAYGAYELARAVIEGIRRSDLDLVRYLANDVRPFDPHHPDPPESFKLPASPTQLGPKPLGN